MTLKLRPLPYVSGLQARPLSDIDLLVIHCTELPDLATAREYGEHIHHAASNTGNSGHYYIDRDGSTECWVMPERVAHHTRGYNDRSLGIELVNLGRYPDWLHSRHQELTEPYTGAQIQALTGLIRQLRALAPRLQWVAGHEELDREEVPASDNPAVMVRRKRDPGPLFPWQDVLKDVSLTRFKAKGE